MNFRNSAQPGYGVLMFILTEKPSVAADFAKALFCSKADKGIYSNASSGIEISHCQGHLFQLEEPAHYSSENFPVIPQHFDYTVNPNAAYQAKAVVSLLKKHKNDEILIATDADREGEIIARECLLKAGISDLSKIKRFWVSQALTAEVIKEGIKKAQPLSAYNSLSSQGFARQHADWLVGMNFSRYISNHAKRRLSVGRVQTAILSAIEKRCSEIEHFEPQKYFEYKGYFNDGSDSVSGLFISNEKTSFFNNDFELKLNSIVNSPASLKDTKEELKKTEPALLYNLNACQKDAFSCFEYSAKETLEIIQPLYEKLKCVSYPRTPSRVMGSFNVELCQNIFSKLISSYPEYAPLSGEVKISLENKRCFDDSRLEAHHALIPLAPLPEGADEKQKNIYSLIIKRFMTAFLPPYEYLSQVFMLDVSGYSFKISGRKTKTEGWKKFKNILEVSRNSKDKDENEEEQVLDIDWSRTVTLQKVETLQKFTKPPKYFNEASILSFMENPTVREVSEDKPVKLTGLGTPATRHTFIPYLTQRGYIITEQKKIKPTELGINLLDAVRKSEISFLADIASTTEWEQKLSENPVSFESEITGTIRKVASSNEKVEFKALPQETFANCPSCHSPLKEGKMNYYCSGYKDGCKFQIWKETSGTSFSKVDAKNLCEGKKTGTKQCKTREGKSYSCKFYLDKEQDFKLSREFINNKNKE